MLQNDNMVSFELSSVMERIRVLTLYKCANLKSVDLGRLPMLRSVSIKWCANLKEIIGWENLCELGWIKISECPSYHEHLKVHCLPSLKEFVFQLGSSDSSSEWNHSAGFDLDFSQCFRLRKVRIEGDIHLAKSVDLSTSKFLEKLTLSSCAALESIVGLSELPSVTEVKLSECFALKRLPYLGRLKALVKLNLSFPSVGTNTGFEDLLLLTHLSLWDSCSQFGTLKKLPDLGDLIALSYLYISFIDVDKILGLEKLHSLTHLILCRCKALKRLPYLGQLKALTFLDISESGVDEIPGVRDLVNLETLICSGSQLEWLPDLDHLPRLKSVFLYDTPLVRVPSSKYFEKPVVKFNEGVKWEDEVADVSDPDYVPSDQEAYYKDNDHGDSSDG